jgi:hypothetical protein
VGVPHDHELEVLEDDQTVPPRPEEAVADAEREPVVSPRERADDLADDPSARPVSGP